MRVPAVELRRPPAPVEYTDQDAREELRSLVESMNVTTPDDSINGALVKGYANLTPGHYGGFDIGLATQTVSAVGGGAIIKGKVTIKGDVVIRNLHFRGVGMGTELISIKSDSIPIFIGCIFEKDQHGSADYILVEAGSKVTFTACLWAGADNTVFPGNLVNIPLAADCLIQGGRNLTLRPTGGTNSHLL